MIMICTRVGGECRQGVQSGVARQCSHTHIGLGAGTGQQRPASRTPASAVAARTPSSEDTGHNSHPWRPSSCPRWRWTTPAATSTWWASNSPSTTYSSSTRQQRLQVRGFITGLGDDYIRQRFGSLDPDIVVMLNACICPLVSGRLADWL